MESLHTVSIYMEAGLHAPATLFGAQQNLQMQLTPSETSATARPHSWPLDGHRINSEKAEVRMEREEPLLRPGAGLLASLQRALHWHYHSLTGDMGMHFGLL